MSEYTIDVSPTPSNSEFIGEITIKATSGNHQSLYQTIIILDRSGSMGNQVQRMVNVILPKFFEKLSYQNSNIINLITFESISNLHAEPVRRFRSLGIKSANSTHMRPAVDICRQVFQSLYSDKPVRVLTISDGKIQDQPETKSSADNLAVYLESTGFFINSKAVRLFTSSSQPDTTALCSMLQINNAIPKSLVDIPTSETDDAIATKMAELFMHDNFNDPHLLTSSMSIMRSEPWSLTKLSKLHLSPGKNSFWMTQVPFDGFKVNGVKVKINEKKVLTKAQQEALLGAKAEMITEKAKVLKVIDSTESAKALHRMNAYLGSNTSGSSLERSLNKIANDTSVANMSTAEKALYVAPKKN